MIEKCRDWMKPSTKLADEYYRAVTRWAVSRRSEGSLRHLIKIGSAYRWTLEKALRCLRSLRRTEQVERKIAHTEEYKALVTKELETLRELE